MSVAGSLSETSRTPPLGLGVGSKRISISQRSANTPTKRTIVFGLDHTVSFRSRSAQRWRCSTMKIRAQALEADVGCVRDPRAALAARLAARPNATHQLRLVAGRTGILQGALWSRPSGRHVYCRSSPRRPQGGRSDSDLSRGMLGPQAAPLSRLATRWLARAGDLETPLVLAWRALPPPTWRGPLCPMPAAFGAVLGSGNRGLAHLP